MSSPRVRALPSTWRFALVGALASLPVTAVLNRVPNSEATLGGGVMTLGAFVAGAAAATRSVDPDAAGLRAGLLGGALGVLALLVRVVSTAIDGTAAWPLTRVAFWAFASGVVLCVAPLFGLACGRIGGWVAKTVASRGTADESGA